jgi:GNAT superfamily N-acetyltransferase
VTEGLEGLGPTGNGPMASRELLFPILSFKGTAALWSLPMPRRFTPCYASWREDELLSLFVHPDFQGRGMGSALMSACFDDANATISIAESSMAVMAS